MKYVIAILGLAVAGVAALYFFTRKPTAVVVASAPLPPTYTGNRDAQNIQAAAGAVTSIAGAASALFGMFGGSPTPSYGPGF